MRVIALSADCYKFLVFENVFQMFMNCVFTNRFSFNCWVRYYQLNLYLNFILLKVIKTEPMSILEYTMEMSPHQSVANLVLPKCIFLHFCL